MGTWWPRLAHGQGTNLRGRGRVPRGTCAPSVGRGCRVREAAEQGRSHVGSVPLLRKGRLQIGGCHLESDRGVPPCAPIRRQASLRPRPEAAHWALDPAGPRALSLPAGRFTRTGLSRSHQGREGREMGRPRFPAASCPARLPAARWPFSSSQAACPLTEATALADVMSRPKCPPSSPQSLLWPAKSPERS